MSKALDRLNRLFDKIAAKLPWSAKFLAWLRNPKNAIVRVPVAILLILGGIFSILPFLGLWMLPLGLIFLSIDLVFLQEPVTKWIVIGQRKLSGVVRYLRDVWSNMRRWWA
jgi:hypothetical protein